MTLNARVTGRDDWTTATFDIAVPDDDPVPVTGMVRLWFGIHKHTGGWWRLTHLPTGFAIGGASTEGQLVRAVSEIKNLIDWDFSDRKQATPEAAAILKPAMKRHNALLERRLKEFSEETEAA